MSDNLLCLTESYLFVILTWHKLRL